MALIPSSVPSFFSTSRDVSVNLALEETFMAEIQPDQTVLFFYENDPAVVIGRFQNPWQECRTGLARRQGIPVRRRISGGGTVVHAAGNLNIAIIVGKRDIEKDANLDHIIVGCRDFGLEVQHNSRYDLLVTNRTGERFKVSGSAFRQTSRAALHHSTLLVNADLNLVRRLLKQPAREIESRGVPSKPSPIANLSDDSSRITLLSLATAISQTWKGGLPPTELSPEQYSGNPVFQSSLERLTSDEWIWRKTPAFRETFTGLSGLGTLVLEISDGRISSPAPAAVLNGIDYQGPAIQALAGHDAPAWIGELARRVDGD